MKRVFVDFHHSSLLRSLVMLFEDRLGMELYRPIGMDWFEEGFWSINGQRDTAEQFLSAEGKYSPKDGTPLLNKIAASNPRFAPGSYHIDDPGGLSQHWACTLEFFKNNQFDYVIASLPQHIPLFKKLIELYQPGAKLIVQVGNNWNLDALPGEPVLASVAPHLTAANAMFYHQEFDTELFAPTPVEPSKKIYSFVNVIKEMPIAWNDYCALKLGLESFSFDFKSFGGQNPDGNTEGPGETAEKMREAMLIFHVKPTGDGFGHVIHNAYALGRPVITRSSHYRGQLAEQLLVPGTFIDLDRMSRRAAIRLIAKLSTDPHQLATMGQRAADQFKKVVDYNKEGEEIRKWLESL